MSLTVTGFLVPVYLLRLRIETGGYVFLPFLASGRTRPSLCVP